MMIRNDKKTMQDIVQLTAALIDVDSKVLLGNNRRRDVVCGRMALANFLNFELKYHYADIAKYLGRDRTNIYHYEGRHKDSYDFWKEYRALYDNIKASYVGVNNASMTNNEMSNIIKSTDIKNDINGSFKITFKIGFAKTSILTSDLEITIKKLKDLFSKYNYNFSVEHKNTWSYEV
tara:strand:+ start:10514 stop:11044 length:531 start_codon:yes stop_codon:yes gene_type:complete